MDASGKSNNRANLAVSGWACIVLGSGVILSSGATAVTLAIAAPVAISGIALLMAAIGMDHEDEVSEEEIHAWAPGDDLLPDAGGPMYRTDTTLIPPVRTSVLCGRCGNLEMLEGHRPPRYRCQECNIDLWEEE